MTDAVTIVPAGDAALFVEFDERIDLTVNRQVIAVARAVESARLPGVRDIVPTYRSVAVYFDPLHTEYDALVRRVAYEVDHATWTPADDSEMLRMPVCYEGDCAPDLANVAALSGVSPADVIALHAGRTYRV